MIHEQDQQQIADEAALTNASRHRRARTVTRADVASETAEVYRRV